MVYARLITEEDLVLLKQELFHEIRELKNLLSESRPKKWLVSKEVQELLHISRSKLHEMRQNGTLPYSMLGKICYHSLEDIEKILDSKKVRARVSRHGN